MGLPKFLAESTFLTSLKWLQSDTVEFVAESDESDSNQSASDNNAVAQTSALSKNNSSRSEFWGPIRRERWRQRKLKEEEPFITFRDWLLTGTYPLSYVMINAGLFGIDVSNWKDEDFPCLNPEVLSISNDVDMSVWNEEDFKTSDTVSPVVQASCSKVLYPSNPPLVQPSTSKVFEQSIHRVVEPSTSKVVEQSNSAVVVPSFCQVDVSSWKDEDFKVPARPNKERKDAKGKVKRSKSFNKPSEVPIADASYLDVDVTNWNNEDFTQKE